MTEDDPRHGSTNGYAQGCRCDACRLARTNYQRNRRALMATRQLSPSDPAHGTRSGYDYYGCRCGICALAHMRVDKRKAYKRRQGI